MTTLIEVNLASPETRSKYENRSKSQPRLRHHHLQPVEHRPHKGRGNAIEHIPNCPNRLIHDPLARKSDKHISTRVCRGDGDLWLEKECVHMVTGKHMSFFYSAHTGRRIAHEPPTGASRVLYMSSNSKFVCGGCLELFQREKDMYQARSVSPIKRTKL